MPTRRGSKKDVNIGSRILERILAKWKSITTLLIVGGFALGFLVQIFSKSTPATNPSRNPSRLISETQADYLTNRINEARHLIKKIASEGNLEAIKVTKMDEEFRPPIIIKVLDENYLSDYDSDFEAILFNGRIGDSTSTEVLAIAYSTAISRFYDERALGIVDCHLSVVHMMELQSGIWEHLYPEGKYPEVAVWDAPFNFSVKMRKSGLLDEYASRTSC